MIKKERKSLASVIISFIMFVTLIGIPLTAMAAEGTLDTDQEIPYVNSNGEEVTARLSDDGFCYRVINSDGQDTAEILGIRNAKGTLTIPDKIGELDVTSFAIDPRWPVWDELYNEVTEIILPKTINNVHSSYMEEFLGLEKVSINKDDEDGDFYKSQDGVLFKKTDSGCKVDVYPLLNPSKTFVMPSDMNEFYEFFDGCPVESITISRAFPLSDSINPSAFSYLENLKEILVETGNEFYEAADGVLYKKFYDEEYNKNIKELVIYPQAKEDYKYIIPDDVTDLGNDIFCDNTYIKTVVINSNSLIQ